MDLSNVQRVSTTDISPGLMVKDKQYNQGVDIRGRGTCRAKRYVIKLAYIDRVRLNHQTLKTL